MPMPSADVTPMAAGRRLSPGLWIAAAAEIAVAFVIATIILGTDRGSSSASHADMPAIQPARIDWETTTLVLAAITAGQLIWWLATRARIAAVLAAVGLIVLGTVPWPFAYLHHTSALGLSPATDPRLGRGPDVSHVCRSHAAACQTSRATTDNPTTSRTESHVH